MVAMFEYYASLASKDISDTEKAGRYLLQQEKEKNIFEDVYNKLNLSFSKSILDVGCGCGVVVRDLIRFSKEHGKLLYLSDSQEVLNSIQIQGESITKIPGRFPNSMKKYDKLHFDSIIVYSVLHYIPLPETEAFINKLLSFMKAGSNLLLGDIPNLDAKERFCNSEFGKRFNHKLKEIKKVNKDYTIRFFPKDEYSHLTDNFIMNLIKDLRNTGLYNVYLLPQSSDLPFGYTREDLLIVKL